MNDLRALCKPKCTIDYTHLALSVVHTIEYEIKKQIGINNTKNEYTYSVQTDPALVYKIMSELEQMTKVGATQLYFDHYNVSHGTFILGTLKV